MAKPLIKLRVRIPEYRRPRTTWRQEIHKIVAEALQKGKIRYTDQDRFEIVLRLYLSENKLRLVDVDNRLKDVLDALQGHVGGAGTKHRMLEPLIPNDNQIFRVFAEKCLPPKQSAHGRGHLTIRIYKGPNYL